MVVALGLAGLAALIALAVYRNPTRLAFERAAADLPAAEADARRLGLPLSGADLVPKAKVRPEDNAAPLIREAGLIIQPILDREFYWKGKIVKPILEPTSENEAVADSLWLAFGPAIELGVQASQKPSCDFERPWDSKVVWTVRQSELEHLSTLVDLLGLRAYLRTKNGNTAGALDDFRSALALCQHAGSDPNSFSAWQRGYSEETVFDRMEDAISARPQDSSFLQGLDSLLVDLDSQTTTHQQSFESTVIYSVELTRVPGETLIEDIKRKYKSRDPWDKVDTALKTIHLEPPGVSKATREAAYQARVVRLFSQVASIAQQSLPLIQKEEQLKRLLAPMQASKDPTFRLMQFEGPVSTGLHRASYQRDASLAILRGLIAVRQFHIRYGRYPENLTEAGATLQDPLTFEPLKLGVNGDEVRVYSPGFDGVDDKGRIEGEPDPAGHYGRDFVSMYPRRFGGFSYP